MVSPTQDNRLLGGGVIHTVAIGFHRSRRLGGAPQKSGMTMLPDSSCRYPTVPNGRFFSILPRIGTVPTRWRNIFPRSALSFAAWVENAA